MNGAEDIPDVASERVERLVCRYLDGEASPEERAELASLLAESPDARSLLAEYESIDKLAAEALRQDVGTSHQRSPVGRFHGWRLGFAGALLAAAAVIAMSFLAGLWSPDNRLAQEGVGGTPGLGQVSAPDLAPQFVNHPPAPVTYREKDHRPSRRWRGLKRDLIGVRDSENKNVIYIFERDMHSTTIVPLSGDI